jgi:M6 family metalloprotease-like protein
MVKVLIKQKTKGANKEQVVSKGYFDILVFNSLDRSRLMIFLLLLSFCGGLVYAMPASPIAFEVAQPDGRKIQLHIRGDEFFHWNEDTDGYTVVKDNGRFVYGKLNAKGRLGPTGFVVGRDNPKVSGLKKRILPLPQVRKSLAPSMFSESESISQQSVAAVSPSGTVKNLVVLCKFSDHTYGVHTRDANDYDILFNQIGGHTTLAPTGSVKDLYLENSYGVMTLESTVVAWVTLPQTEGYYADGSDGTDGPFPTNAQGMVRDALELVDPLVDFSQFDDDSDGYIDAIDIIHSGYGAETGGGGGDWIWSHRWSLWQLPGGQWTSDEGVKVYNYHTEPALWSTSGTNIVRFGVIAHETGHFFGLPDLYDTDGSGSGIGSWGMMANSWGFDNTQLHPPHFCGWSKIFLGWLSPTVIGTPGNYSIGQLSANAEVYRIDYGYPSGEYLLIENRQPAGIESAIPQGGLCIFHIDDNAGYNTEGYPGQSGWPENGNHYRVAVLQADGDYDLEKDNNRGDSGDVYHSGGVSLLSQSTVPNTDAYQDGTIIVTENSIANVSSAGASMSFVYDNGAAPSPPVAQNGNASTQINTLVSISLVATDEGWPNPPGVLNYIITSLPSHGSLSDPGAGDIGSVPYTLADNGNQVDYTPDSEYIGPDSFQFKANDGGLPPDSGDSNVATVSINIVNAIYFANMDSDPGWTFTGSEWEWGVPTGSGGEYGNPDPTSGYTGSNVIGYNLSGDYNNSVDPTEWATTPAIDCTAMINVTLSFYRWLNVEMSDYDHAYIEVSNDGSAWNTIWENSVETTDSSWTLQTYDISAFADAQPTVYIRWGMGTTDVSWRFSGWNIDDVGITGDVATSQHTLTTLSTAGGSVTTPGEPGPYNYDYGTNADIVATPSEDYYFVNWTGSGVTAGKVADPNAASTTITMDNNYSVGANFSTEPDPPALPWSDDFETGGGVFDAAKGWVASGNSTVSTDADYTGTYGAMLKATAQIEKAISTTGFSTIHVKYARTTNNRMDPGEYLYVEWYDGTIWHELEATQDSSWVLQNMVCSSGADNNPNFKIRFRTNAGNANERAYIDDVEITGQIIIPQRVLSTSSTAGGSVTTPGEPGPYYYTHDTPASIVATPVANYHFVNWTGDTTTIADINAADTTITMDDDYSLHANFAIDTHTVTFIAGAGGSIAGNLVQVVNHGSDCSAVDPAGNANYHFVDWTGDYTGTDDPLTITNVTTDMTITANFAIDQKALTTSSTAGGSVTTPGESGPYYYTNDTLATIVATPDTGYHFINWTGDTTTIANINAADTTITMDDDYAVQANFAIDTFTLNYAANSGGTISGDTSQTVDYRTAGSEVSADPNIGYHFVNWSDASTENPRTDTNVTANISVAANFAIDRMAIYGYLLEPDDTTAIEGILIEMSNLASTDITDPNGYYELTVDYGWSGIVEPNAVGYIFEPNETGRTLTNVTSDTELNLTGYLEAFVISGNILENDDVTPIEGVTVTPQYDGGHYTATYNGGGSDITDANGLYEVWVDYDFSGSVTPTHNAYVFDPNKLNYSNVMAEITGQDYVGTMLTYKIAGCIRNFNAVPVPIEGVDVYADNGGTSDITDPNGCYEVWVDYNWSGTVTPTKNNYSFDPNWIEYTDVLGDQLDQDYTATNIYDLDLDGAIGLGDVKTISDNWLLVGVGLSSGDIHKDEDDIVNLLDFARFADVWGD